MDYLIPIGSMCLAIAGVFLSFAIGVAGLIKLIKWAEK